MNIMQRGVGLVEVLVALILLGLGVMGYTALQLRAIEAGDEALMRSQATMLLRGLTESIRANPEGQKYYLEAINNFTGAEDPSSSNSCLNTSCKVEELAEYDAFLIAKAASDIGGTVSMATCPGVNDTGRLCLFFAWGTTTVTSNNYQGCMTANGVYRPNARCVMMEAY